MTGAQAFAIVLQLITIASIGAIAYFGAYLRKKAQNLATKEDLDLELDKSYLKIKAENFATKEDFQSVLGMLEIQTSTVERIKTEISFSNWKRQEWNSTRAQKIEELLKNAFELRRIAQQDHRKLQREWTRRANDLLKKQGNLPMEGVQLIYEEGIQIDFESEAILNIQMLCALYFPELSDDVKKIHISINSMQLEISNYNTRADAYAKMIAVGTSAESAKESDELSKIVKKINEYRHDLNSYINSLSKKAAEVLQSSLIHKDQ